MKIKVLLLLGEFQPTVPHFGVMRYENQQFGVANPHKNAKTLLPTKFQPNQMKIEVLLHFGGFQPTVPHFWGQKT